MLELPPVSPPVVWTAPVVPGALGQTPWTLPELQLDARADATLRRALDSQQAVRDLPVTWRRPDGRLLQLLASGEPRLSATGKVIGYWGVARDVTPQHRGRQALQRSEALLSLVVSMSPDIITLTDLHTGCYVMVNESFCRVLGRPHHEVIGRTAHELGVWHNPADRDRLVQEVAPGDLAMPTQYFDWTRGPRARSFFGDGVVLGRPEQPDGVAGRGQPADPFDARRREAAAGVASGDGKQLFGQPDEILGFDIELRQRIAAMPVEPGGDDHQFGGEAVERRQNALAPGRTKLGTAAAGGQRHVHHVARDAAFAREAGAGIERILVRRGIEERRLRLDDGLRSLAVMNVEVDDRHTFDGKRGLRMPRTDRDVVEEAEAAGDVRRRVMARRPDGGKGRPGRTAENPVDCGHDGACRVAGSVGAAGTHHRVGVDMDQLTGGRPNAQNGIDIAPRMDARQLFDGGFGGHEAFQAGEFLVGQDGRDCAQPVRSLGVVVAGVVLEKRWMTDQQRHRAPLARFDDLRQSRPQRFFLREVHCSCCAVWLLPPWSSFQGRRLPKKPCSD